MGDQPVVRPRPMVRGAAIAVVWLLAIARAVLGASADSAGKAAEPLDRLPYRIRVALEIDPETRIDALRRDALVSEWQSLIRRFVGAPWRVETAELAQGGAAADKLESLDPETLTELAGGVDKVWVIRIGVEGPGLVFSGREFDVPTRRLGGLQRRSAPVIQDVPRELLRFAFDLFSPYAEIGERSGKDVFLTIRGASIMPATPSGAVVVPGAIFQPLRIVPQKGAKKPLVRAIAYTFLRVEEARGTGARCSMVSVLRDPLTSQVVQETSLAALGVKPGKIPTRLRFVTQPDQAPAGGYVLTARRHPDGTPRDVGTTDREGRITLEPRGEGLLVLRLLAGSSEPMVEFPLMPGLDENERSVPPFDPKPLAVTLETRLDALRDAVIDLVAVRSRLEARIKARLEGDDLDGATESLKEFQTLTPRKKLADELLNLKTEAAGAQVKGRKAILTRTAQAQLADLEALVDRYLTDDVVNGLAEAIAKLKAPPTAKALAKKGGKLDDSQPIVPDTPEKAYKAFTLALAAGDEPTLRNVALPGEDFDFLLKGDRLPPEKLAQFRKASVDRLVLTRLKAGAEHRLPGGKLITIQSEQDTDDRVVLVADSPSAIPTDVYRVRGSWKVDARHVIASRRLAALPKQAPKGPIGPAF